jgi:dihydrodipicolinate synthase/N-acetylneuraminate lyase
MYTPDDLHGLNAMMPAFAKEGAESLTATDTVDVDKLTVAVDRMINDGANAISTTGSFGEVSNLLWEETQTLFEATRDAVNKRVPLMFGITSWNGREVVRKARFVRDIGGEGIFVGVPFYYTPTVDNAVAFYKELSELFPDLSIQIYHNPTLHRIHIPVEAFEELSKLRNIVSMKDSHRTPMEFMALQQHVRGKISIFTFQLQYYPYQQWGARGFWSTDAWMGPWPLLYLRDVTDAGDYEQAEQVVMDISGGRIGGGEDVAGPQDNARKLGYTHAGYCDLGPNRSPYMVVKPESLQRQINRAERWKKLCEKYRPLVEANARATVAAAR